MIFWNRSWRQLGSRALPALSWVLSFLRDGRQEIKINIALSEESTVSIGVPQGSTFSADIFAIFMNDLLFVKFHGKIIAFAVDICFIYSVGDWDRIGFAIERSLVNKRWVNNAMDINVAKTRILNFYLTGFKFSNIFKYHT